jgi:hypothetical protein
LTIKAWELATARKVVYRVLSMFDSYYKGLDRKTLRGGWAPGYSEEYDKIDADCTAFAHTMAEMVMKDLDLLPVDTPEDESGSRPSS